MHRSFVRLFAMAALIGALMVTTGAAAAQQPAGRCQPGAGICAPSASGGAPAEPASGSGDADTFQPGVSPVNSTVSYNGAQVNLYGQPNSSLHASLQNKSYLTNPQLQLIFYGRGWQSSTNPLAGQVDNALVQLIHGPYLSALSQYGFQGIGTLPPVFVSSGSIPNGYQIGDIGTEVTSLVNAGTVPSPVNNSQIVYVVLTDASISPKSNPGAHSDTFQLNDGFMLYLFVDSGDLDHFTGVLSHELVETITDPYNPGSLAWGMNETNSQGLNDEIADACQAFGDYLTGILVQSYWSNAQNDCVIPFPFGPAVTVGGVYPPAVPATGGTRVQVTGANFSLLATTIRINGVAVPGVSCPDSGDCFFTAPAGLFGNWPLTVSVGNGTGSSSLLYLPAVTGLSAHSGASGDIVTVYGSVGSGMKVSFGPYAVTTIYCDGHSDGCQVAVPSGGGQQDVVITWTGIGSSQINPATDQFTYNGPVVTSVSPANGPVAGGTTVWISGSGFDPNSYSDNSTQVYFVLTDGSRVQASNVGCNDATSCVFTSPQAPFAGYANVEIVVGGSVSAPTGQDLFLYDQYAQIATFFASNAGGWVGMDGNADGALVHLSSSDPRIVSVPATATIAGQGAGFAVSLVPWPKDVVVTLTATYKGQSMTTTISVLASPPVLLTLDQVTLDPGQTSTATVQLLHPAPSGGAVVTISGTNAAGVSFKKTVTVSAGAYIATFDVTNNYTGTPKLVTITATYDGHSGSASVLVDPKHINPPGGGCGLKCV